MNIWIDESLQNIGLKLYNIGVRYPNISIEDLYYP